MRKIPWKISFLATVLLASCDSALFNIPDTAITIDAHNCFPSCQSFAVTIRPNGETAISVFRTFHDGRNWRADYEGIIRKQSAIAAYTRLRDAVVELESADLEQLSGENRMPCANSHEPLLRVRRETELAREYSLYLSCPQHRDIALKLGKLAMELSEGSVRLDDWPLDKSQAR